MICNNCKYISWIVKLDKNEETTIVNCYQFVRLKDMSSNICSEYSPKQVISVNKSKLYKLLED